jgi:DNA mismatch endonuclease (patch repair protein)
MVCWLENVTDVFSKRKRSALMSRIRGRGNKATELEFVRLLRVHKVTGWRRHVSVTLPKPKCEVVSSKHPRVRPDFVFPASKIAIFIDGCFWHGCPIHGTWPANNRRFWSVKLDGNRKRDRHVTRQLRRKKWLVFRFWEHQLGQGGRLIGRLRRELELRIERA